MFFMKKCKKLKYFFDSHFFHFFIFTISFVGVKSIKYYVYFKNSPPNFKIVKLLKYGVFSGFSAKNGHFANFMPKKTLDTATKNL